MATRGVVVALVCTVLLIVAFTVAFTVARAPYPGMLRSEAISNLSKGTAQFLLLTFAVGVGAMAALESAKKLFRLRGAFHVDQLNRIDKFDIPLLTVIRLRGNDRLPNSSLRARADRPVRGRAGSGRF